mgnify:CR=1 FL=1
MGDARWNFLRLLCQWRNDLEVTLLPPMQPNQQELRVGWVGFWGGSYRVYAGGLGLYISSATKGGGGGCEGGVQGLTRGRDFGDLEAVGGAHRARGRDPGGGVGGCAYPGRAGGHNAL